MRTSTRSRSHRRTRRRLSAWRYNWLGIAVILVVPLLLILGTVDYLQPIQTGFLIPQ